jgi:hypothetical protein
VISIVCMTLAAVGFIFGLSASAITADGKIVVTMLAVIFLAIGLFCGVAGAIPTWLAYRAGDSSM